MTAPTAPSTDTARWPDPMTAPLLKPEALHRSGLLPGMGRSSIYEAIRRGDLPSIRVGSRIFVPTAQLLEQLGLAPSTERSGAA